MKDNEKFHHHLGDALPLSEQFCSHYPTLSSLIFFLTTEIG